MNRSTLSALTNTNAAWFTSRPFHSRSRSPAFFAFDKRLSSSARYGTTTTVTPGSLRQAGAMNSMLFSPPVGSTTTSGVKSPFDTIARSALRCVSDRNDTSFTPSTVLMACLTSSPPTLRRSCTIAGTACERCHSGDASSPLVVPVVMSSRPQPGCGVSGG